MQKILALKPRSRGFHLITSEVVSAVPQLAAVSVGVLHLFLQHTSAALTLNENADPDVRQDLNAWFNRMVADRDPGFTHTLEGPDDMSAHVKTALLGNSLSIPVTNGILNMGVWQGIYLCEHRIQAGPRTLVLTLMGE